MPLQGKRKKYIKNCTQLGLLRLSRGLPPELVGGEEDEEGGEDGPEVDDGLGDISGELVLAEFDADQGLDDDCCEGHPKLGSELLAAPKQDENMKHEDCDTDQYSIGRVHEWRPYPWRRRGQSGQCSASAEAEPRARP